ncbi:MAG: DUF748 domain-containing protein [Comamonadaceae bacterium]
MIKIAFQRYTKIIAVLVGVVFIYAAVGFWVVPSFLQKQIPGWGVATLDRKVSTQAIAFNPFTLRLKVDGLGLAENDDTPVLTIARVDVALEWGSLVRGTWRFSDLHVSSPELQLKVSKNGVFNMAQWIESYEERNPSSSSALPRLLIQQFQITDGKIHFQDLQSGYQNQFDPVEFKLKNLSTLPNESGSYTFTAQSDSGAQLRWSGETTLNSLKGKGELVFEKVALSELAKYLKPYTRISVASGQMDLRLPYTFSYAAGKFDLGLTDAQLKVGDLSVLIPQADGAESLKVDLLSGVLDLAELRNDPARPIPFNARLVLKDGGELQTQGQFTPTTKLLAADLTFKSVALKPLQPFLAPYTPLQIASGTVSGQGRISPGVGRSTGLRYVGSVKVAGVELKEPDGDVFAQWKDASAEKIILGLDPISVRIPELIWVEPSAKFAIEADRSFSAAGLMIQTKGIDSEKVSNPSPVGFNVQRLRIQQGQLDFTDRSLNPQFKTKLFALNGVINSLSNKKDTRSQIALDGRVNEFGLARIRGDMDLFNLGNNTQINAQLKNLDLPSASPYTIKFAGYAITDGKMTLDLQYKVRANQVEGNNKITIDALTLGQRVDSLTALRIPLELAIALLKDDAGRIELGLPVTGNMNDPQFSFDSLIWKALGNALTKIVSAPFRALASLFGQGSDANTLDAIGFDPGSETLLAPEQEKLLQIARMLSQRQQLKITIPEHYNPALDSPVLITKALRKEIYKRAGIQFDIDEPLAPLNFSSRAIRKAMREMYAQRLGADALQERIKAAEDKSLLQRLGQMVQSEPQFADPAAFYQGLYLRLQETQTLSADALNQLGVQRALAVSKGLSKAGVSSDRIVLTARELAEQIGAKESQVQLQLGLVAR